MTFTPCVLPVIPITLAYIGTQPEGQRARNLGLTSLLVLAMALSYAIMGYLSATFGWTLGFLFQNIYFLVFVVVLYLFLALGLFGLYQLQLPYRLRQWVAGLSGRGVVGAVISGITIGLLAAPCVGPIIAALLLFVAQSGDPVYGFSLLLVFGLGMGQIFLGMALFYETFSRKLRAGHWTVWVERALGVLLIIPALYYGTIAYQNISYS